MAARSRVSFLFEARQAANIDDQSLFALCQSALKDIESSAPTELQLQMHAFQQNLLSESSLKFYRGTRTKDANKATDKDLAQLLRALSPYYLEVPATHKVVEYLVRIYEVQSFLKHDFLFSFLPYYETVWFARAAQLCNLKEDQYFNWLHEVAYKGEQVSRHLLVHAIG